MNIPLAIWITVTWGKGASETFLYRTAGNSFYERFGKWKPYRE